MSGRRGKHVFFMRGPKLCRRLYIVPRNVRTAARRRARGAFGAISKAWSQVLTEEQRQAWMVAAAKVQSHPRLWQSGPLTGEMHFEGINSSRAAIGRGMLLWPPEPVVFGPNPVAGCRHQLRQWPGKAAVEGFRAGDRGHHGVWAGTM